MSWDDTISDRGLFAEMDLVRTMLGLSNDYNSHDTLSDRGYWPRAAVAQHIRDMRLVLAAGIRDKSIPYPSKSDPDKLAVVMRALLEA